jgi:methylmalonyl-CoA/ethylmalonyl-CoA epimerase
MRLEKVDHNGILVKSIESSLGLYREHFGLPLRDIEVNREYRVRIAFLPLGEVLIELVEPLPGTPLEKVLREKGEGFQHIAFEVDHLTGALEELKSAGGPFVIPSQNGVARAPGWPSSRQPPPTGFPSN